MSQTEWIRRRPQLLFGSEENEGANTAVHELLRFFVNEGADGACQSLSAIIHKDGAVTVHSRDRGLLLDDAPVDGTPVWRYFFCEMPDISDYPYGWTLYGGATQPEPRYAPANEVGFRLLGAQCTSEYMHVEAVRDGCKRTLDFAKGFSTGPLRTNPSKEEPGTRICFKPDGEVFGTVDLSFAALQEQLRAIAVTVPGLRCEAADERTGQHGAWCFEQGIFSVVQEAAKETGLPLFRSDKTVQGSEAETRPIYTAHVRAAIGFCTDAVGEAAYFHNCKKQLYDGLGVEALLLQTCKSALPELVRDAAGYEALRQNMLICVDTHCPNLSTSWTNGAKQAICNKVIARSLEAVLADDFSRFLCDNRESIYRLFEK